MQLALRVCRSALPRRAFPPRRQLPLTAGFLSPTWWIKCDVRLVRFLVVAAIGPRCGKVVNHPKNEERCLLFRRAGFSKTRLIGEILNYLLASLIRSSGVISLAKLGRGLLAVAPNPNPGLPGHRHIPAQRDHAVAREWTGYVWIDIIGTEGMLLIDWVTLVVNREFQNI